MGTVNTAVFYVSLSRFGFRDGTPIDAASPKPFRPLESFYPGPPHQAPAIQQKLPHLLRRLRIGTKRAYPSAEPQAAVNRPRISAARSKRRPISSARHSAPVTPRLMKSAAFSGLLASAQVSWISCSYKLSGYQKRCTALQVLSRSRFQAMPASSGRLPRQRGIPSHERAPLPFERQLGKHGNEARTRPFE